ncbi:MAG: hypothetical protein D3903_21545 [Candidatus Electrothrix sp. GM3_4]|nr:hypothetical protein [Candidatus Electrothrix sp. GM3_4]
MENFMAIAVSSWKATLRLIIIITFFLLMLAALVFSLVSLIYQTGAAVSISGTTISIGSEERLDSALVDATNWTDTNINIKEGDKLTFNATGSVNVALGHMIQALDTFAEISSNKKDMRIDLFTEEEIKKSLFPFPWNGPKGLNLKEVNDQKVIDRIKTSRKKFIYPEGEIGQLLAFISKNGSCPDISSKEEPKGMILPYYGPGATYTAKATGKLCFVINDVITEEIIHRKLIWQDNTGFFSIKIHIESNKSSLL